jgi:hypothetical protein
MHNLAPVSRKLAGAFVLAASAALFICFTSLAALELDGVASKKI